VHDEDAGQRHEAEGDEDRRPVAHVESRSRHHDRDRRGDQRDVGGDREVLHPVVEAHVR